MARSLVSLSQPTWLRFARWLRRSHVASRLAVVLTVAAILSGIATYVVLSGWLRQDADADLVLGLLYLDVILLLLLGALVARGLVHTNSPSAMLRLTSCNTSARLAPWP